MVKIRLRRVGAKKQPSYRVVVTDSRAARDSRFLEVIGHYNPRTDPPTVVIKEQRALYWLGVGAQPTDPVRRFFDKLGLPAKLKEQHAGGAAVTAETNGHAAATETVAVEAPPAPVAIEAPAADLPEPAAVASLDEAVAVANAEVVESADVVESAAAVDATDVIDSAAEADATEVIESAATDEAAEVADVVEAPAKKPRARRAAPAAAEPDAAAATETDA